MPSQPLLPKEADELVIIGQIGAPFGIKGWNHVQSFTRPIEGLLTYRPWYVKNKEGWVVMECEKGERQDNRVVVKVKGVDDRDKAALLTQCKIAVKRSQMAELPEDTFYWSDLQGMSVELESGKSIGKIRHLYDNAGTDIMLIENEGKEYHIPFIMHDTVIKVDVDSRRVIIDWDFDVV